tara:strand:- start:75 stop:452 length:378 start_codon:yes stop_codon:yes gene_type:complete
MHLISNNETSIKNYIITGIICVPVIIGFVHWYNTQTTYKKIIDKKKQVNYIKVERPYWILAIMILTLISMWLFLPILLNNVTTCSNDDIEGISNQEILKNNQKVVELIQKKSPVKKRNNRNQLLF